MLEPQTLPIASIADASVDHLLSSMLGRRVSGFHVKMSGTGYFFCNGKSCYHVKQLSRRLSVMIKVAPEIGCKIDVHEATEGPWASSAGDDSALPPLPAAIVRTTLAPRRSFGTCWSD